MTFINQERFFSDIWPFEVVITDKNKESKFLIKSTI